VANTTLKCPKAELRAIDYWDREYKKTRTADEVDRVAYEQCQDRCRDLIREINTLSKRNGRAQS